MVLVALESVPPFSTASEPLVVLPTLILDAAAPLAPIVLWVALSIVALSVAVGTPFGDQLPGRNQSLLVAPVHVLSAANAGAIRAVDDNRNAASAMDVYRA